MQKQLKTYFKTIKKNLPCLNSVVRKMLDDLKVSVNDYITQNNCIEFQEIEKHFGAAEDIAKEFAVGIDNAYVKSYKLKKRIAAVVVALLTAILIIVTSLSIYIYIENENNSISNLEIQIVNKEDE